MPEKPSTVTCTICGRSWSSDTAGTEWTEAQEVKKFQANGGYGNHAWGDLIRLEWAACQDCVGAWLRTAVLDPVARELRIGSVIWPAKEPMPLSETEFRRSVLPL